MAGIAETLEQLRTVLGNLPEKLAASLQPPESKPAAYTPAPLDAKLKEAEDPYRSFFDIPLSGLFQKPGAAPQATFAEDEPEYQAMAAAEKKEADEKEEAELYGDLFADAGKSIQQHKADVENKAEAERYEALFAEPEPEEEEPEATPRRRRSRSEVPSAGREDLAGAERPGSGGEAVDLAEVVTLLERIATAVEKLDKAAEPTKPHGGESSGPARWRAPDPDEAPTISIRSKQTGRALH